MVTDFDLLMAIFSRLIVNVALVSIIYFSGGDVSIVKLVLFCLLIPFEFLVEAFPTVGVGSRHCVSTGHGCLVLHFQNVVYRCILKLLFIRSDRGWQSTDPNSAAFFYSKVLTCSYD